MCPNNNANVTQTAEDQAKMEWEELRSEYAAEEELREELRELGFDVGEPIWRFNSSYE
jgi:hypothetical protein